MNLGRRDGGRSHYVSASPSMQMRVSTGLTGRLSFNLFQNVDDWQWIYLVWSPGSRLRRRRIRPGRPPRRLRQPLQAAPGQHVHDQDVLLVEPVIATFVPVSFDRYAARTMSTSRRPSSGGEAGGRPSLTAARNSRISPR